MRWVWTRVGPKRRRETQSGQPPPCSSSTTASFPCLRASCRGELPHLVERQRTSHTVTCVLYQKKKKENNHYFFYSTPLPTPNNKWGFCAVDAYYLLQKENGTNVLRYGFHCSFSGGRPSQINLKKIINKKHFIGTLLGQISSPGVVLLADWAISWWAGTIFSSPQQPANRSLHRPRWSHPALSHLSLSEASAPAFSSRKRMTSVWPSAAATWRADLPS